MAYLLDANVFISAKNLHYGFDFCPGFWDWITRQAASGVVRSIERVHDEIRAGDDELAHWVDQLAPDAFLAPDRETLPALTTLSDWVVQHPRYTPAAVSGFLQSTDYYLVAQALAGAHTIVTHETPADSVRRVKIPTPCLALGVSYVNPFEMLRRERARFVLKA